MKALGKDIFVPHIHSRCYFGSNCDHPILSVLPFFRWSGTWDMHNMQIYRQGQRCAVVWNMVLALCGLLLLPAAVFLRSHRARCRRDGSASCGAGGRCSSASWRPSASSSSSAPSSSAPTPFSQRWSRRHKYPHRLTTTTPTPRRHRLCRPHHPLCPP